MAPKVHPNDPPPPAPNGGTAKTLAKRIPELPPVVEAAEDGVEADEGTDAPKTV